MPCHTADKGSSVFGIRCGRGSGREDRESAIATPGSSTAASVLITSQVPPINPLSTPAAHFSRKQAATESKVVLYVGEGGGTWMGCSAWASERDWTCAALRTSGGLLAPLSSLLFSSLFFSPHASRVGAVHLLPQYRNLTGRTITIPPLNNISPLIIHIQGPTSDSNYDFNLLFFFVFHSEASATLRKPPNRHFSPRRRRDRSESMARLHWLEAVLPLAIIAGMLSVMGNAQYYIHRAAHGRPKHIGNDMWDVAMERRDKKLADQSGN